MFPRENHSNGYEQVGAMGPTHTHTHRERVRRGTRRSRASSSSHSVRVFDQSQPHHRPPCTDFDVAYFHSYAHLGIHQEMIKVPLPLPLLLSFHLSLILSIHIMLSDAGSRAYWDLQGSNHAAPEFHCRQSNFSVPSFLFHHLLSLQFNSYIFSFFYMLCKCSFPCLQITMYFMN